MSQLALPETRSLLTVQLIQILSLLSLLLLLLFALGRYNPEGVQILKLDKKAETIVRVMTSKLSRITTASSHCSKTAIL